MSYSPWLGLGPCTSSFPITVAIVVLLAILVFSYRQVIDAYPGGGGAYAVSRANLGPGASLVAGAAFIVDYTLTVAVSIAAGVGSLTSAFPGLSSATVPLCLGILVLITLLNLRGLGETARAFLLPTMLFIVGLLAIIAIGLVHPLALNAPQPGHSLMPTHGFKPSAVLLVLKAFSAGCSALTGVEAIANGVPLFKQPRVARAKRTELLLGVDPRYSCCWAWPSWPGAGTSALDQTRPSSARSWLWLSAGIGPTTSCPSRSPSS